MTRRSVNEHMREVRALLAPAFAGEAELIAVTAAFGRVLGADVHSPLDLPLFRNSQMDGFAVASASVQRVPVTLPVTVTIAAGDAGPTRLTPGTAVRIMTGAPVPDGADAVVPVEETDSSADEVTVRAPSRVGEYIRDRGSDIPPAPCCWRPASSSPPATSRCSPPSGSSRYR